jgi:hypothetical protein
MAGLRRRPPPASDIDAVIAGVRATNLTYLPEPFLQDLVKAVREADAEERPGVLVECGTALGGSAIVMAAAKAPGRELRLYDAFGMIPPPTEEDGERVRERYEAIASGRSKGIGGDTYYGYRQDLLGEVVASFARFGLPVERSGVRLVKGYFADVLVVDYPVALAHLDGDWYESTMVCLRRIVPQVVPGGRLIIDDYDAWEGCCKAVDEYFDGRAGFRFERWHRLHIVRER